MNSEAYSDDSSVHDSARKSPCVIEKKKIYAPRPSGHLFKAPKGHNVHSTSGTLGVDNIRVTEDLVRSIVEVGTSRHNVRATSSLLDLGMPFHGPEDSLVVKRLSLHPQQRDCNLQ